MFLVLMLVVLTVFVAIFSILTVANKVGQDIHSQLPNVVYIG